jgi:DNA-binding response OmpR family regulator
MTIDTPVVLIVEDDPPVRALLADVLQDEGYEVVAVHDGATALQVIDSLKVDLITVDLELPGISGMDMLDILRKRSVHRPPVIMVTSTKPVRRQIRQMAHAVITKPFDVDEFLQAVLDALPPRLSKAVRRRQDGAQPDVVPEQPPNVDNAPNIANDSGTTLQRKERGQDEEARS